MADDIDALAAEIEKEVEATEKALDRVANEDLFAVGLDELIHGQNFDSSNVQAMRYDPESQSMYVTYQSGGTYRYWTVNEQEAREMFRAASKGKAIWQYFRVAGSATAHKKNYAKV